MKNEARDAVANLRESIDMLVLRLGLDLREESEDPIFESVLHWQEFVMNSTPDSMMRELEAISKIVNKMDKQIDILEAIDDNDIMEHAYNDLKQIAPEEC